MWSSLLGRALGLGRRTAAERAPASVGEYAAASSMRRPRALELPEVVELSCRLEKRIVWLMGVSLLVV